MEGWYGHSWDLDWLFCWASTYEPCYLVLFACVIVTTVKLNGAFSLHGSQLSLVALFYVALEPCGA